MTSIALQALRGRKLALISNRADPILEEKVKSEIQPEDLNYVVADRRRIQSLCDSISNQTYDAVLFLNSFMSHSDVAMLVEACKKAEVPFVPCGKGRWLEMSQNIERCAKSLSPLLVRPPKLRPANGSGSPLPANDLVPTQWDNGRPPTAPTPEPPQAAESSEEPKPKRKIESAKTRWTTLQLVWLEHWVGEGITQPQVLGDLLLKRFGVKRTVSAIKNAYPIYFRRTLEGRESITTQQQPLPRDFETVKAETFGTPAAPAPPVEPKLAPPVAAPAPVAQSKASMSMDVKAGSTSETLIIDMKGAFGEAVIETKRTQAQIMSYLMGFDG